MANRALVELARSGDHEAFASLVREITARTPRRPAWQFLSRWLPIEPSRMSARTVGPGTD